MFWDGNLRWLTYGNPRDVNLGENVMKKAVLRDSLFVLGKFLEIRTGDYEFVFGWFAGVAHGPGVYEAEFVGAAAACAEF